jgi:hypothetical protein
VPSISTTLRRYRAMQWSGCDENLMMVIYLVAGITAYEGLPAHWPTCTVNTN